MPVFPNLNSVWLMTPIRGTFIDEIGEMDPILLNKLLSVEDKEFSLNHLTTIPTIPSPYIKKIEEGVPADFVLIGRQPGIPRLNPALRSRCAEVYFVPLEPSHIAEIVKQASRKLDVQLEENIPNIISEYVIEGRKANSILLDAYET